MTFSILLVVFVISSFASASSPPPSESPPAEVELICHTDNPAECYPKVFSATEEFQVVHDDQDLPPGLHVQLDMQTGQKQAKLYDPKEDNPALEGLPVDRGVMVVEPEMSQDDPAIPSGAPAYEPVGVVKAPKEKNAGFTRAMEILKAKEYPEYPQHVQSDELDEALQDLEDLSHDMYYGLQIAEDTEALKSLFCLLNERSVTQAEGRPLTERTDFLASSILASAIRNNIPGLRALERSWDVIMDKQCNFASNTLKQELYQRLVPMTEPASEGESTEADFIRLNLAVLDGLLKSPKIRTEFLANDGMKNLLQVLLREGGAWEPRRAKTARIVSDIFLDEDAGATLGVWPTQQVAGTEVCAKGGPASLGEGCWEYHVAKIGQNPRDAAWSEPLLSLLKQRRPGAAEKQTSPKRDEL